MEREMDFLKDKGCISLRKLRPSGECKTASDFDIAVKEDMMRAYSSLTDKISAWKDGRSRESFGESQRLAQLDELAGQMEVHA
jgi:hypothetical protein